MQERHSFKHLSLKEFLFIILKRIRESKELNVSHFLPVVFTGFAIFPLSDFLFNLSSLQGFELWLEHGAKKTRQFNLI